MGWDITYHPFNPDEVAALYFAAVEDPAVESNLAKDFQVSEIHQKNLQELFKNARRLSADGSFATGHGYHLACLAGYLRRYWYVRGSALSFLFDDENFRPYFSDWQTLVPEKYTSLRFDNRLPENFSAGVFLTNESLEQFKNDFASSPGIREKMAQIFSHGRLEVFRTAVDFALNKGLGLFEAAEVVIPNPLDLNASNCQSNLHNCDPSGALLYHKAALEQIMETRAREKTCAALAPQAEAPSKPGLFSRLFGRMK